MLKLQQAIATRWDSTAGATLRGLATGGLWIAYAKHGAVMPYVVLTYVAGATPGTMTEDHTEVMVQFGISVGRDSLETGYAIRDALIALYDNWYPTFATGGHIFSTYRENPGLPLAGPDEDWLVVVEYRFKYVEA